MAQLSLWDEENFLLALPLTCEFSPPAIDYDYKIKKVAGTSRHLTVGSGTMDPAQTTLRVKIHGTSPSDAASQSNEVRNALLSADRLYDGIAEWWLIDKVLKESPPRWGYARLWCEITYTLQLQRQLVQFDLTGGKTEDRLPTGGTT
ncbi:hypothetical protein [Deinococcus misasensis]|uniref:hypothetical protein n=1 Tax=Deinococcus misasensis TaxID=392413 RepID=UPI000554AEA6|nr:hypothetical protein [Deinococcus misasensis]